MLNILLNAIKIAFLLGFLIFIHELGHFLVARLFKIKVNEFAIGFGPIIWKKQGKQTKYVLRAIPLGGFVNLLGEEEQIDEEGSFSKASAPKKMGVLVAGGAVNIIFGIVVYFCLMACLGTSVTTIVDQTVENYAASEAGIVSGDKIVKINEHKVRLKSDIDKEIIKNNGETVKLTIIRDDKEVNIEIKPTFDENENKYYLGIIFRPEKGNTKDNLRYAFWSTVRFSSSIVENVKELFTGNVGVDQLTGPVGISEVVVQTKNIEQFIYILALISLSLGVTNLLPFPPLDGGKILLLLIESITRKPIKENVNVAIQMTGFAIIMALALYVTYNDILRIF